MILKDEKCVIYSHKLKSKKDFMDRSQLTQQFSSQIEIHTCANILNFMNPKKGCSTYFGA